MSEENKEHFPIDPQDARDSMGEQESDLYHEFEFVSEDELTSGSTRVEPGATVPTADEEMPTIDLYGSDAPPCPEEILEAAAEQPAAEVQETRPQAVNRPAEGARQALPGEVLSQGFQGSENAGDFLGLDLEFIGSELEPAPELELAQAPQSQPAVAPGELMAPAEDGGQFAQADGVFDEGGAGEFESELDPEFDDVLGDEEEIATGGRGKYLVLAALFGALVVGGATLYPKFLGADAAPAPSVTGDLPRVATRPNPSATPESTHTTPQPDVAEGTETAVIPEGGPIDLGGGASEGLPSEGPSEPVEVETAAVSEEPIVEPVVGNGVTVDPLGVLVDAVPLTDSSVTPEVATLPELEAPVSDAVSQADEFPDFSEGFEWVTPDNLDMVWRGEEVPMEAIFAPARTLMPHVGNVRVHMRSGDTIEGRLYAVGEERVWIDLAPGRVGLDGREVVRFERLSAPVAASVGFISGEAPTSRERVRVKAPGGTFYGKVVAQEGSTVTLLQDGGGRVVLRDAVVEPAVRSRAIVVQR